MKAEPVAITGMGAVTPYGDGVEALHAGWAAGECKVVDGVARCLDFDPESVLEPFEVYRLDRFAQLAMGAAEQALRQAGWLDELPVDPHRVASVIGTSAGATETYREMFARWNSPDGRKRISAHAPTTAMANSAAAAISMHYGLKGEAFAVVAGCAAGAQAIGAAMRMLQRGEVDAVVTGGAEAAAPDWMQRAFQLVHALSPTGRARPFDRNRDGYVMGEGAGVMVLERMEVAERRGASVLGEVLGYGASSDAYHITAPDPEAECPARAIGNALADAGVAADRVRYVNAHGTGTELNDPMETRAIKRALGEHAYEVPVSSLKSAIGHLLGAAGAVEAIETVQALARRTAPPTVWHEEPEEGLDLDYVPGEAKPIPANGHGEEPIGISNSFGFGGHNSVLVLRAAA